MLADQHDPGAFDVVLGQKLVEFVELVQAGMPEPR